MGNERKDPLPATAILQLEGRPIRVLDLGELLQIKRRAGRPKDLAVIPYIEATLEELARRSQSRGEPSR